MDIFISTNIRNNDIVREHIDVYKTTRKKGKGA